MVQQVALPRLSELPDWREFERVGLDTETHDPGIKDLGPGVRRDGYLAGISIAMWKDGHVCSSFYLPIRHAGGGNYENIDNVIAYLRHQAHYFRGDICGANLQYDLDYLAQVGVKFTPRFFRDIQVSGPLLLEPEVRRMQDPSGRWFWGEVVQKMSLNAQAQRLGMNGKDEAELIAWAEARGLDPKGDMWKAPAWIVDRYAKMDAELPLEILAEHERMLDEQGIRRVYDLESRLLPVLLKMRRRGVSVDVSKVDQIEARAYSLEVKALRELAQITGVDLSTDDTNTPAALAKALNAVGIECPKTEKTNVDSVKTPWLKTLDHPAAKAIVIAKKWNKVRRTFCQSIRNHEINGRIHCTFNQLKQEQDDGNTRGAEFGRLSSSNPNLQQQPARDPEIGSLWRSIFLPDEGGEWACLDFSSQEPRMITHFAEVMALHNQLDFPQHVRWDDKTRDAAKAAAHACRTDPDWDNHSMMASFIYGDEYSQEAYINEEHPDHKHAKHLRGDAKQIFLGTCYGMGGGKLCRSLGLPTRWVVRDPNQRQWTVYDVDSPEGEEILALGSRPFEMAGPEGQVIIDKFNVGVPYIKALTKLVQARAKQLGYITTILGRRVRFPINPDTGKMMNLHKALNLLIQPSSADQTKQAMVDADDAGIRMQLQVHDELDLTIWSRSEAEQLNEIMVNAVPLRVPTRCDIETGPSWGEIK